MDSLKSSIQTDIQQCKVLVYSKSYCPFAAQAKQLLKDGGVEAKIYELDQMPNGGEIQQGLLDITGQRTVPNIFINGKHIGGCSEIEACHAKGELKTRLAEAGVANSF